MSIPPGDLAGYDFDRWIRRWSAFTGIVAVLAALVPRYSSVAYSGPPPWVGPWSVTDRNEWDGVVFPFLLGVAVFLSGRLHPAFRGKLLGFLAFGALVLSPTFPDWSLHCASAPSDVAWGAAILSGSGMLVANHLLRRYPGTTEGRWLAGVSSLIALGVLSTYAPMGPRPRGTGALPAIVMQYAAATCVALLGLASVALSWTPAAGTRLRQAVRILGYAFLFLGVPAVVVMRYRPYHLEWWVTPPHSLVTTALTWTHRSLCGIVTPLLVAVAIAAVAEPWIRGRFAGPAADALGEVFD